MLVLSRKIGERIVVPDCNLVVTVVAIEGNKVRLGFAAPAEIGVYREEVWRQLGGIEDEGGGKSRHAGRVQTALARKNSDPFFITVFHGDTSNECDSSD